MAAPQVVIQIVAQGQDQVRREIEQLRKLASQTQPTSPAAAQSQRTQSQAAAQAAREQATAAKQAAKEQAAAAQVLAREQAAAAKQAAREQTAAAKQVAREQATAAKQAARETAVAKREEAQAARQAAREQATAAREAARAEIAAAREAEKEIIRAQRGREQARRKNIAEDVAAQRNIAPLVREHQQILGALGTVRAQQGGDAAARLATGQMTALSEAYRVGAINAVEFAVRQKMVVDNLAAVRRAAAEAQQATLNRRLAAEERTAAADQRRRLRDQAAAEAPRTKAGAAFAKLDADLQAGDAAGRAYARGMEVANRALLTGAITTEQFQATQERLKKRLEENRAAFTSFRAELKATGEALASVAAANAALAAGGGLGASLLASRFAGRVAASMSLGGLVAGLGGVAALGGGVGAGILGQRQQIQEQQLAALGAGGARRGLVGIGLEFGDLQGAIDQFRQLAIVRQDVGASTDEMIGFERRLYEVLRLQGGVTASAQAGLRQFTQALASGRFAGDEFRSGMENIPIVMKAISRGLVEMGIALTDSSGELRALSESGQLTGRVAFEAFLRGSKQMTESAKGIPLPFTTAVGSIVDSTGEIVGAFGRITGVTDAVSTGINAIADAFRAVALAVSDLASKPLPAWLTAYTDIWGNTKRELAAIQEQLDKLGVPRTGLTFGVPPPQAFGAVAPAGPSLGPSFSTPRKPQVIRGQPDVDRDIAQQKRLTDAAKQGAAAYHETEIAIKAENEVRQKSLGLTAEDRKLMEGWTRAKLREADATNAATDAVERSNERLRQQALIAAAAQGPAAFRAAQIDTATAAAVEKGLGAGWFKEGTTAAQNYAAEVRAALTAADAATIQQTIERLKTETAQTQELTSRVSGSVEAYREAQIQIAAVNAVRQAEVDLTSDQGRAIYDLTVAQLRLNDAQAAAKTLQDLNVQIAQQQRLTAAVSQGEAAFRASEMAIAGDNAARQQNLDVTSRMGRAISDATIALQEQIQATERAKAVRDLGIEIDQQQRLLTVVQDGAAVYRNVEIRIAAENEVRRQGIDLMSLEGQMLVEQYERRARLGQQIERNKDLLEEESRSGSFWLRRTPPAPPPMAGGTGATDFASQLTILQQNAQRARGQTAEAVGPTVQLRSLTDQQEAANQDLAQSYNLIGAAAATATETASAGIARSIVYATSFKEALLDIGRTLETSALQAFIQFGIGGFGTAAAGPAGTRVTGASGLLGVLGGFLGGGNGGAAQAQQPTLPGAGPGAVAGFIPPAASAQGGLFGSFFGSAASTTAASSVAGAAPAGSGVAGAMVGSTGASQVAGAMAPTAAAGGMGVVGGLFGAAAAAGIIGAITASISGGNAGKGGLMGALFGVAGAAIGYSLGGPAGGIAGAAGGGILGGLLSAQRGMSFTVPGAGGEDRHLFATRLHGGERVDITPAREVRRMTSGSAGEGMTIYVDARQADPGTAAAAVNAALRAVPMTMRNYEARRPSPKRPPW